MLRQESGQASETFLRMHQAGWFTKSAGKISGDTIAFLVNPNSYPLIKLVFLQNELVLHGRRGPDNLSDFNDGAW